MLRGVKHLAPSYLSGNETEKKYERIGFEHLTLGGSKYYRKDGTVDLNMDILTQYNGMGHCKAILFEERMGELHRV